MSVLPIVLVHGIRLSGACWSAVREQIANERPSTTVDLPGHGTRRGETFTLPGAVESIHAEIDRVGGRAVLVGHSLGGFVSVAAAAGDPSRVAGLVVAGASCTPTRANTAPFLLMHRMLSRRPDGGTRISGRIFDAVLPGRVANDVKNGGIATEAIPEVVAAIREFDLVGNLARYPGPTWIVNGARDHLRAEEQRCLRASPQGRLIVVPRAGHYLPLAQPVAFGRLIQDAAAGTETALGHR
ncbi:alpha/beta hydrolase [Nocardia sp. NPDC050712]|uniref:alpha/beta fold hydrolase n=1 Tax=Nocardia sp. NPDC050712 TaxID=3155518 RepID=UPI0033D66462